MFSKKTITCFILSLLLVFMLSVCLFCSRTVFVTYAEETPQSTEESSENEPTEPGTEVDGSTTESPADSISERVKAYLQSIYGDDYEKYYNEIIEHWGSIENFLLNASENMPEEYRYKATELLTTVNAYIGVGADMILLLFGAVFLIYIIKKQRKTNADLTTLKACDNQIEEAQLALIESQKAQSAALQQLMPGEKFEGARAALVASDKALDSAAEEVKKIV